MSRAARVNDELLAYIERLPELMAGYDAGPFWGPLLTDFGKRLDSLPTIDPNAMTLPLDGEEYGFTALPKGIASVEDDPGYVRAMQARAEWLRAASQMTRASLGLTKDDFEHMRALDFLIREGLFDRYLGFLRPLGICSTMQVLRQWYYAWQICDIDGMPEHCDVLDIGGGGGTLAYFLYVMGRVRSYTIVDLPEMLVHSGYTIQRLVDDAHIAFDTRYLRAGAPESGTFSFVPAQFADELPTDGYDLAININSFMEMDLDTRDDYFALIYRVARPGAIFYNVNRRKREARHADGTLWDNNPMLYPYRQDDEILVWEEDPCQTVTRMGISSVRSLAVTRISRIASG